MRKIFLMGLLALIFGLFDVSAFAGGFSACEDNKALFQEFGVYGLCNAWHNAETDEDRAKFEDKFSQKFGDPPPWLEPVDPAGQDPEEPTVCPCWTPESLATAAGDSPAVGCEIDDDGLGVDTILLLNDEFGFAEISAGFTGYFHQNPDETECLMDHWTGAVMFATTPEEDALCRSDVRALQSVLGCP